MELRKELKVFKLLGFIDVNKWIDGLSSTVQHLRPDGPFDGSYYVFCGKTRLVAKILYWDKTSVCLCQKRLEMETFPWPREESDLGEMTRQNIRLLLKGVDVLERTQSAP